MYKRHTLILFFNSVLAIKLEQGSVRTIKLLFIRLVT